MSELNKAEFEDLSKIITDTIRRLVECADKHNIDRDSLVMYFAKVFCTAAEVSTFKYFETEETPC